MIAKFYRPGRWSDAAIVEEHTFARELADAELPVVAPLAFDGHTLLLHEGFRYALSPRRGGRAPELEALDQLQWLGRLIARMHLIGASTPFQHRGRLDRDTMVQQPMQAVLASSLLPASMQTNYRAAAERLDCRHRQPRWKRSGRCASCGCTATATRATCCGPTPARTSSTSMMPAPAPRCRICGCWPTTSRAMEAVLEGYQQFRDFDLAELALIPALRAMRQLHYAGWIAARWHDPAFPAAFPFAAESRWWEQHLADLHELADELA